MAVKVNMGNLDIMKCVKCNDLVFLHLYSVNLITKIAFRYFILLSQDITLEDNCNYLFIFYFLLHKTVCRFLEMLSGKKNVYKFFVVVVVEKLLHISHHIRDNHMSVFGIKKFENPIL